MPRAEVTTFLDRYRQRSDLAGSILFTEPGNCERVESRFDTVLKAVSRNIIQGVKNGLECKGNYIVRGLDPIASFAHLEVSDPAHWTARTEYHNLPVFLKNPDENNDIRSSVYGVDVSKEAGVRGHELVGIDNGITIIDGVVYVVHFTQPRRSGAFEIGRPVVAQDQEGFKLQLLQLSQALKGSLDPCWDFTQ